MGLSHLADTATFWINALITSAAVASAWVNLILNLDKLL
jgi:hypothetical protein